MSHYSSSQYPTHSRRSDGDKPSGIKPGYFFLLGLLIYSVVITVAWRNARQRADVSLAVQRPQGLWMPITGAQVPSNPAYLPNANRRYRQGINQGFDFYNKDAGIPISYGTPVIAVADGVVTRVDRNYDELDSTQWEALMESVGDNGATDEQLDRLRGRQIWLQITSESAKGWVVRYGHLADIVLGLEEGQMVYQGQVLGYVGNSGTSDARLGGSQGSRLHFELWKNDREFFGRNLNSDDVRRQTEQLFIN